MSPKRKKKRKENQKWENKIFRVHCLELWQLAEVIDDFRKGKTVQYQMPKH